MASLKHLTLSNAEKASGLNDDLQGLSFERSGGRSSRSGEQSLLKHRRRFAWVVDLVVLLLIAAVAVGLVFLYRFLKNTYAPVWEERPVTWTAELTGVNAELISYDRNGDMVFLGKEVYASNAEDADALGIVSDARIVHADGEEQAGEVTLYLTVDATARYRAGKGYWMNDTRLLCGQEYSFRLAGLEAAGMVISLRETE